MRNRRCTMKRSPLPDRSEPDRVANRNPGRGRLAVALVFVALVALMILSKGRQPSGSVPIPVDSNGPEGISGPRTARSDLSGQGPSLGPARTAQEIVADKVNQFGRSRLELVRNLARRSGKAVPPEIERFFAAIESGRWEEIDAQWMNLAQLSGQYDKAQFASKEPLPPIPDLNLYWSAVLDAYGVAEQAHDWPAQKLLDYGNAILNALKPGMVYLGGTDSGRWIPELLNETSGEVPHIIVTQNAMADSRYLDYMQTLYGDQMNTLTAEDSKQAFDAYVTDARRRLEHDQQFPDEPKQVRPGEDIRIIDNRTEVSGQVAVMTINEKLVQALMQKNPDLSFAIQESSPLPGTYNDAVPLGPLMELRNPDGPSAFTAERATESVDYWRSAAQEVLFDLNTVCSPAALQSYSHDAVSAANLLAGHNFTAEAEEAFRLATQIWPENPESVGGLAALLASTGRDTEARGLLDDFARRHPGLRQEMEKVDARTRFLYSNPAP
jgi:hypothetical protein